MVQTGGLGNRYSRPATITRLQDCARLLKDVDNFVTRN